MEEYRQAQFVLVVRVVKNWTDDGKKFFTDLAIDEVLKSHDSVTNRKTISVERNIRVKSQFIVFGEALKDSFDLFKGMENSPDGALKEYLLGAIKLKDKKIEDRLRYCFDHLENTSLQVASDAHLEFAQASAKEIRAMAKTLPADKIAAWVRDAKTDAGRRQFYGFLLGYCGTAEDGKMLRSMIGESVRSTDGDITGFLKGHVMLQPKEGWDFVRLLLADDTQPYRIRHDAMHVANFLRSDRADLIDSKALTDGVSLVLDHPDLAARGVDFLRRVKAWDRTDQVLGLYDGKKKLEMPLRGVIVCFALQSPEPRALAFVKELRTRDPNFVAQMETALVYAAESAGSEYIFELLR